MLTRVRSLGRFLLLGGVTAGFLWLFTTQADLGQAAGEVGRLPAWSIAAGVAAALVNLGFMTLRWRYLFGAAGFPIELGRLFATLCAGIGANNVLPARAGDLVRIESLRRSERVPAFVIVGTLFAERLLDGVVLAAFLLAGALLLGAGGPLLLTAVALAAGTALGVVLVVLAASKPRACERGVARLTRLAPSRWRTRIERAGMSFVEGLGAFRSRRTLLLVLATSTVGWLANVGLYVAVGVGFGLDAGFGGYLALEGIGNLALGVPATAAGVGSFDYLTLVTAMSINVPEAPAAGYVLVVHALTVIPVSVLGLVFLRSLLPARGRPVLEPA